VFRRKTNPEMRDETGDRDQRRRRGQALVEAAVAFPLVVLLLLVTVQGALYVHARHVVLGAVREGAHAAAMEHATVEEGLADGKVRAQSVLRAGLGQYARDFQVLDPVVDSASVVVQVQGSMRLLLSGPGSSGPVRIPMFAEARATREFFDPQGRGGF
jgi:Flp pilus assembly protein TadG